MKTPHTYVTSFTAFQDASNYRLENNPTPVMDTKDPYLWLELDDIRRFQTDRQILESAVDLSQSCLTSAQKVESFDLLEKYKDAFCLCTILRCRHLPISTYGNGFEHFTCYMANFY